MRAAQNKKSWPAPFARDAKRGHGFGFLMMCCPAMAMSHLICKLKLGPWAMHEVGHDGPSRGSLEDGARLQDTVRGLVQEFLEMLGSGEACLVFMTHDAF